jgi:hypothetical protein
MTKIVHNVKIPTCFSAREQSSGDPKYKGLSLMLIISVGRYIYILQKNTSVNQQVLLFKSKIIKL